MNIRKKKNKHTQAVKHSWIKYPSVQVHFTRKRNCRLMYAITAQTEQNHLWWHLTALDTPQVFTDCHHQWCLLMLKKPWNHALAVSPNRGINVHVYRHEPVFKISCICAQQWAWTHTDTHTTTHTEQLQLLVKGTKALSVNLFSMIGPQGAI